MFSSLKRIPGTALALILLTSPVYAADVSAEGAAALKTLIQSEIDARKNVHTASGSELITQGDLKVETADGYYAVTMPHIKVKDGSGVVVDVGMFAANVIPGDTPKEWKASFAIPTPINIIGKDGQSLGNVSFGKQRAAGVWDLDLKSFTRLDGEYGDIAFTAADQKNGFKIAKSTIRTLLKRDSVTGNLSGPSVGVFSDWSLNVPDESFSATIKDMNFEVTVKDFDPKVAQSFNEQVMALGQNGQTIAGSVGDGQNGIALYNMLTDVISKSSDSFTTSFGLNGLSVTGKNAETQAPETFELGTAGFGFDMGGFRSGSVKMSLRLNYGGLKLNNVTDPYKDLIPFASKIDLSINNLPFKELVDLGRGTMTATAGNPDAAQMAGLTAMMTVPKLLTDAGTNLTHTLETTADSFKIDSNGVVNANIKAILGYTADENLTFTGLDKIVARINEEIKKPNNPEAATLQSVLGTLSVMQMVGQKDPSDPDKRTYKLVVDEQGKTLMNGADLSTLMGGAGGAAPVPGAEPAPAPAPVTPDAPPAAQ